MAVAKPTLVDYTRPTPTTGVVHADDVAATVTCRAYYISMVALPPVVTECGDAVGDGNPNLEIDLDLTGATWSFFGIMIPQPIVVFLVSEDTGAGEVSLPSDEALPQVLDFAAHGIEIINLRRVTNDLTKIQFVVTGMPTEEYTITLVWINLAGDLSAESVTGNGYHVLTSDFDPSWPYSFVGLVQDPDGTFLRPLAVAESFTTVLAPPTLNRVLTDEGDRQMEVYWTPPNDQRVSGYQIYYRNKTRNEPGWNVVTATASPTVIEELKRGDVYEVQMVSQDGVDRSSLPTHGVDVFVRG